MAYRLVTHPWSREPTAHLHSNRRQLPRVLVKSAALLVPFSRSPLLPPPLPPPYNLSLFSLSLSNHSAFSPAILSSASVSTHFHPSSTSCFPSISSTSLATSPTKTAWNFNILHTNRGTTCMHGSAAVIKNMRKLTVRSEMERKTHSKDAVWLVSFKESSANHMHCSPCGGFPLSETPQQSFIQEAASTAVIHSAAGETRYQTIHLLAAQLGSPPSRCMLGDGVKTLWLVLAYQNQPERVFT